jgi:hypothetical protein
VVAVVNERQDFVN